MKKLLSSLHKLMKQPLMSFDMNVSINSYAAITIIYFITGLAVLSSLSINIQNILLDGEKIDSLIFTYFLEFIFLAFVSLLITLFLALAYFIAKYITDKIK